MTTRAEPAASIGPKGWTENAAGGGPLLPWRELWAYRELVGFFALRDLRVRYKQALLGVVWVVLQPLVTVGAFTLVFDRLADVPTGGLPYPVFALAGLVGWSYLSQCVLSGSEVLVSNSALITKVWFPRLLAPIAALLPPLVDLGVGLIVLAIVGLAYGIAPTVALLALPLWVALLMLTAIGPVAVLAAANVRFRDVRHVVGPLLQALLFLSPVAYSAASLDGSARWLYALNPVAGVLELGRFVLVGADFPGVQLVISVAVAAVTSVLGVLLFQRAARSFADVI